VNESLETAFLYVDAAKGSDSNPGTAVLPLKTISKAITFALVNNRANIGTRVIINPGVYRESLTVNGSSSQTAMPMTFEAETNGTVFVSGAVQYTSWSPYGAKPEIYVNSWPNRWGFCPVDSGTPPLEQPIVLRREMVFIGGVPMTQVLSLSQMLFPGTFFVDETAGLIYVWPPAGTNMSTADVEVATSPNVLNLSLLNGVVFRGLTFTYANSCHGDAAVLVSGSASNVLLDSDNIVWNGGQGIILTIAANVTLMNSVANHNGAAGFNTDQVKNFLWQNITAAYNNWRGAQGAYYSWDSGGAHLFANHNETISGFKSIYNQTFGLHWDTDTENVTATNMVMSQNLYGLVDEKGQGPLSVSNSVVCGSSKYGFVLRDSEQVTLTGNTFYNNASAEIFLTGVPGGQQVTNWETGQVYNLINQNLTLKSNVIDAVGASQQVFADGLLGGAEWISFQTTLNSDSNTWWNASNTTAFAVPVPQTVTYLDFPGWQTATLQDVHSTFSAPTKDPSGSCAVTADGPDWWLTVDNGLLTTDVAGNAVFNFLNTPLGGWTGTVTLAVDGISAIPGATAQFSPTTVSTGGTSALTFHAGTHTPPGTYTFTVLGNNGNVTRTVTLSVTVLVSSVRLSAASLAFNNQPVGTTSPAQTVTLTNTGVSALGISSIASFNNFFAESNTCGASLAAGKSCTISVTFTPQSLTPYSGHVTITDTDGTSPQTVTLAGTTVGSAKGKISPLNLNFGNVVFKKPSAAMTATLTNAGTADLIVTSIAFTGANSADFSQANTCGSLLAVNASCSISVTFTPKSIGARTAALVIASNATNSPQTVSLSGTGISGISVSPLWVGFGGVRVGVTSPSQSVTVTNLSAAALTMSSISITGTNPGDFTENNSCVSQLAGGAACTISLTMTPQANGSRAAALNINDSDPTSPQTVTLAGTGSPGATVLLTPTALSFGNEVYLKPSASQAITLKNVGSSTLSITSLTVTGTNSADYKETNTCGSSVAAGASCTITVTFTPTGLGARSASISMADNAPGTPQTAALTGTGIAALSVSPASLAFPSTNVGSTSSPQAVTLTNAGTAAIAITSFTFTGTNASDFKQTNTCGSSLAGGGTCTVSVRFTPGATGSRSASLSVADSDPASPQIVTLAGTGAVAPAVVLTPTALSFGNEVYLKPSASQAITLKNTGSATLSITSLTVTGANSADYKETNTCGSSVAAGASCTITVTFTPTRLGARSASISIADNAPGTPQTAALTGTGIAALSVSPASLAFPSTNVGSTSSPQAVTLTNAGTAAIAITSFTFTGANGPDFRQTNTCGSSLAGGGSCTITVTFKPTATGSRTAEIDITDADPTTPQRVTLTGSGT
jgi:Right handed beta helix region/Abnormal spindle-like microcephaly-assoc'd, ASPM-SPD-2-Hydin